MTSFQAKVAATILLAVFFLLPLRCLLSADDVQQCSRDNLTDLARLAVHFWTLANAVWLGVEASKKTGRQWVGWVAGIAVALVLNGVLVWLEVPFPSSGLEGDEDNSFRR
jgi:hypothetical protein